MPKFEPRIYTFRIIFGRQYNWLAKLVHNLKIEPEFGDKIEEDNWGVWRTLEIWIKEASPQSLLLQVQKAHHKHNKTYLKDLQVFYDGLVALGDVKTLFLRE